MLSKERREELILNLEFKRDGRLVDILCFALMPNHFHFLLKQNVDKGVPDFISKFTNSYTKYFNTKNHRYGPLCQGAFKAVQINSEEQMIHLSRYIHLNPLVAATPSWTSLPYYQNPEQNLVDSQTILSLFPSTKDYLEFIDSRIDYAISLEKIKHFLLDI